MALECWITTNDLLVDEVVNHFRECFILPGLSDGGFKTSCFDLYVLRYEKYANRPTTNEPRAIAIDITPIGNEDPSKGVEVGAVFVAFVHSVIGWGRALVGCAKERVASTQDSARNAIMMAEV
jgi:hypothetical protein